jgi:hypothetical protein
MVAKDKISIESINGTHTDLGLLRPDGQQELELTLPAPQPFSFAHFYR